MDLSFRLHVRPSQGGIRYQRPGTDYRITDEQMYSVIDPKEAISFTGKKGSVLFIDSSPASTTAATAQSAHVFNSCTALQPPVAATFSRSHTKTPTPFHPTRLSCGGWSQSLGNVSQPNRHKTLAPQSTQLLDRSPSLTVCTPIATRQICVIANLVNLPC